MAFDLRPIADALAERGGWWSVGRTPMIVLRRAVTEVTATVQTVHELLRAGDDQGAAALLPIEQPYPLPAQTAAIIAASPA